MMKRKLEESISSAYHFEEGPDEPDFIRLATHRILRENKIKLDKMETEIVKKSIMILDQIQPGWKFSDSDEGCFESDLNVKEHIKKLFVNHLCDTSYMKDKIDAKSKFDDMQYRAMLADDILDKIKILDDMEPAWKTTMEGMVAKIKHDVVHSCLLIELY
jgi:hypothetical protein